MDVAPSRHDRRYGREVKRVLVITLFLNFSVLVAKLAAGILAGSLSVISDAIHSSSDMLNNLVGIFIIRLASSEPDDEHPFGHHKFETLAAFGIAWLLLVTAFQVGLGAVKRLLGHSSERPEITAVTIGVVAVTLIVNVFVWNYERHKAKQLRSSFLMADSRHTLSDIYISSSILAGLILLRLSIIDLDSILAFIVSVIITISAYRIFATTIPVLVDRAPFPREYIAEIIRSTPGVTSVHDIMSRAVPGKVFLTMHLVVAPQDTASAHALTEEVERRLAERIGPCHVTTHIEPDEEVSKAALP